MPKNNYPREFLKLRDRIIEHIAIEEIVAGMHETGQFPIPNEWLEGAQSMKKWLLGLVELEVKEEKGEYVDSKLKQAVAKKRKIPNHPAACDMFEPTHGNPNICAECDEPKENH